MNILIKIAEIRGMDFYLYINFLFNLNFLTERISLTKWYDGTKIW